MNQDELITLPPSAAVLSATLEAEGEYTGERLKAQRPELYELVVMMLARGHGVQFIADTARKQGHQLSKNTVRAVRQREGETIDLLRDRLANGQFEFAEQADEAASIILTEIMASNARRAALTVRDVQSLKVASGIAITNGQLLTGKPTVNVGVDIFMHPSPDLNAELAALHAAAMNSMPEKSTQKGAGSAAERPSVDVPALGADRALAAPVIEVQADVESLDQPPKAQ